MRELIIGVHLIARILPHCMCPFYLGLVVRESINSEDEACEFMHSVEKHLLNTFFIVRGLETLAWDLPIAEWCRD
jgi:hypothetical protein